MQHSQTQLFSRALNRRMFVRLVSAAGAGALMFPRLTRAGPNLSPPQEQLVGFPEKTDLILRTDRPPQLETPLHYFRQDFTPNEAFFVRWHVAGIPTHVDTGFFRLQVDGHVQRSLSLSLDDLRRHFEPVSV